MRSRRVLVGIVFSLVFPPAVFGQLPVLDLSLSNLTYTHLPGGSAILEAQVELVKIDAIGAVLTDVRFYLDGEPVGSVPYHVAPAPRAVCEDGAPPNCNGPCPPAEINGEKVFNGVCVISIAEHCGCMYPVSISSTVALSGTPTTLTVTVDADNLIFESDETNNSLTIGVGPSPAPSRSWGTIKAVYR